MASRVRGELRQYTIKYHPQEIIGDTTMAAVVSPYFGMEDFKWFLVQLGDMENYFALNQQIFDYTLAADRGSSNKNYEVPMYFISGSCDWTCPALSAEKYLQEINAPQKEMIFMEGCGHGSQYDLPEVFAGYVKKLL